MKLTIASPRRHEVRCFSSQITRDCLPTEGRSLKLPLVCYLGVWVSPRIGPAVCGYQATCVVVSVARVARLGRLWMSVFFAYRLVDHLPLACRAIFQQFFSIMLYVLFCLAMYIDIYYF